MVYGPERSPANSGWVEGNPSETRPGDRGGARKLRARSAWAFLKNVLGSISSFSATLGLKGASATLGVTAGRTNSGNPDIDLKELVEDISTAMGRTGGGVRIGIIDEMQDLDE